MPPAGPGRRFTREGCRIEYPVCPRTRRYVRLVCSPGAPSPMGFLRRQAQTPRSCRPRPGPGVVRSPSHRVPRSHPPVLPEDRTPRRKFDIALCGVSVVRGGESAPSARRPTDSENSGSDASSIGPNQASPTAADVLLPAVGPGAVIDPARPTPTDGVLLVSFEFPPEPTRAGERSRRSG